MRAAVVACLLLLHLAIADTSSPPKRQLVSREERQGRVLHGSKELLVSTRSGENSAASDGDSSGKDSGNHDHRNGGVNTRSGEDSAASDGDSSGEGSPNRDHLGQDPHGNKMPGTNPDCDKPGGDHGPATDSTQVSSDKNSDKSPSIVELFFQFDRNVAWTDQEMNSPKMRQAIANGLAVPVEAVTIMAVGYMAGRGRRRLLADIIIANIRAPSKDQALRIRDGASAANLERELQAIGIDAKIANFLVTVEGQGPTKFLPNVKEFIGIIGILPGLILVAAVAWWWHRRREASRRPVELQPDLLHAHGNLVLIPHAVCVQEGGAKLIGQVAGVPLQDYRAAQEPTAPSIASFQTQKTQSFQSQPLQSSIQLQTSIQVQQPSMPEESVP